MDAVRRKWRRYRTARRVLKLWEAYRQVVEEQQRSGGGAGAGAGGGGTSSSATSATSGAGGVVLGSSGGSGSPPIRKKQPAESSSFGTSPDASQGPVDWDQAADSLDAFLSAFAASLLDQDTEDASLSDFGSGEFAGWHADEEPHFNRTMSTGDFESSSDLPMTGSLGSGGGAGSGVPISSRPSFASLAVGNSGNVPSHVSGPSIMVGSPSESVTSSSTTSHYGDPGNDLASQHGSSSVGDGYFSKTRRTLSQRGDVDIDRLFGDCTKILMNLLDWVEQASSAPSNNVSDDQRAAKAIGELVNKALNVAELMLRDPKYVDVVRQTPDLLERLLLLLETNNSVESKKTLLRVLSVIASNNRESSVAIGQLDGFKQMLRMLLSGERELHTEVVRTLNHLVSLSSGTDSQASSLQDAVRSLAQSTTPQRGGIGQLWSAARSVGSLAFSSVASEFAKAFRSPAEGAASPAGPRTESLEEAVRGSLLSPDDELADKAANFLASFFQQPKQTPNSSEDKRARPFAPPPELIQASIAAKKLEDETPGAAELDVAPTTTVPELLLDGGDSGDVVAEFLRVQGGLSALAAALQQAAWVEQLDMFELLSRLLFQNPRSQLEFRNMEGYSRLLPQFILNLSLMLIDAENPAMVAPDSLAAQILQQRALIDDVFSLLFVVCLDGDPSFGVGNFDVLEMLFVVLAQPGLHRYVADACIRCLCDVLVVNPLNVCAFWRVGAPDTLAKIICGADRVSSDSSKTALPTPPDDLGDGSSLRQVELTLDSDLEVAQVTATRIFDLLFAMSSSSLPALELMLGSLLSVLQDTSLHSPHWTDFSATDNSISFASHVSRSLVVLLNLQRCCSDLVASGQEAILARSTVFKFANEVIRKASQVIASSNNKVVLVYRFARHIIVLCQLASFNTGSGKRAVSYATTSSNLADLIISVNSALREEESIFTRGESQASDTAISDLLDGDMVVALCMVVSLRSGPAPEPEQADDFDVDENSSDQPISELLQLVEFSFFALKECATCEVLSVGDASPPTTVLRSFQQLARLTSTSNLRDSVKEQLCYCLVEFIQGISSTNPYLWVKYALLTATAEQGKTFLGSDLCNFFSKPALREAALLVIGEIVSDDQKSKEWFVETNSLESLRNACRAYSKDLHEPWLDVDLFDLVVELSFHCYAGSSSSPMLSSYRHRAQVNNIFGEKLAHSVENVFIISRMLELVAPPMLYTKLPLLTDLADSVVKNARLQLSKSETRRVKERQGRHGSLRARKTNVPAGAAHRRSRSETTDVQVLATEPDALSVSAWSARRTARRQLTRTSSVHSDSRPGVRSNPGSLRLRVGDQLEVLRSRDSRHSDSSDHDEIRSSSQAPDSGSERVLSDAESKRVADDPLSTVSADLSAHPFFPSFSGFEAVIRKDDTIEASVQRRAVMQLATRAITNAATSSAASAPKNSDSALIVQHLLSFGDRVLFAGFRVLSDVAAELLLEAVIICWCQVRTSTDIGVATSAVHAFETLCGLLDSYSNIQHFASISAAARLLDVFDQDSEDSPALSKIALDAVEKLLLFKTTESEVARLLSPAQAGDRKFSMRSFLAAQLAAKQVPRGWIALEGIQGAEIFIATHSKNGSKKQQQFPQLSVGYTLRFWVKVDHCTHGEVGLVSLYDLSGQDVLEVFLRATLPSDDDDDLESGRIKWNLCVSMTQRSLDSTEPAHHGSQTVTFDEPEFFPSSMADWLIDDTQRPKTPSTWHHIILTHGPAGIAVCVDGLYCSSTENLTYPTAALGRGNRFRGLRTGRRVVSDSVRQRWAQVLLRCRSEAHLPHDSPATSASRSRRDSVHSSLGRNIAKSISLRDSADLSVDYSPEHSERASIGPASGMSLVEMSSALSSVGSVGSFVGSVSTVHIHEGVLSAQQCRRLSASGVEHSNDRPGAGPLVHVPVSRPMPLQHTCDHLCSTVQAVSSDSKLRARCWPLQPTADSNIPAIDWARLSPKVPTDAAAVMTADKTKIKQSQLRWFEVKAAVSGEAGPVVVPGTGSFSSAVVLAQPFLTMLTSSDTIVSSALARCVGVGIDELGPPLSVLSSLFIADPALLDRCVVADRGLAQLWEIFLSVASDVSHGTSVQGLFRILCDLLCGQVSSHLQSDVSCRLELERLRRVIMLPDAAFRIDFPLETGVRCALAPGAASQIFELLCDVAGIFALEAADVGLPRDQDLIAIVFDRVLLSHPEVSIDFWLAQFFGARHYLPVLEKRLKGSKDKKENLAQIADQLAMAPLFGDPLSVVVTALFRANFVCATRRRRSLSVSSKSTEPIRSVLSRIVTHAATVDELIAVLNIVVTFASAANDEMREALVLPFDPDSFESSDVIMALFSSAVSVLDVVVKTLPRHPLCGADATAKLLLPTLLPFLLDLCGCPCTAAALSLDKINGLNLDVVAENDDHLRVLGIRMLAVLFDSSPRQIQREFCAPPQKLQKEADKPASVTGGFSLLETALVRPLVRQAWRLRDATVHALAESTAKSSASSKTSSKNQPSPQKGDSGDAPDMLGWLPDVSLPGWLDYDSASPAHHHIIPPVRVSQATVQALMDFAQGFPKRESVESKPATEIVSANAKEAAETAPKTSRFSFTAWWSSRGAPAESEAAPEAAQPATAPQPKASKPKTDKEPEENISRVQYPVVIRLCLSLASATERIALNTEARHLASSGAVGHDIPGLSSLKAVSISVFHSLWQLCGGRRKMDPAVSVDNVEALLASGFLDWMRDFCALSFACAPPLFCSCGDASATCLVNLYGTVAGSSHDHTGRDPEDEPEEMPKAKVSAGLMATTHRLSPGATAALLAGSLRSDSAVPSSIPSILCAPLWTNAFLATLRQCVLNDCLYSKHAQSHTVRVLRDGTDPGFSLLVVACVLDVLEANPSLPSTRDPSAGPTSPAAGSVGDGLARSRQSRARRRRRQHKVDPNQTGDDAVDEPAADIHFVACSGDTSWADACPFNLLKSPLAEPAAQNLNFLWRLCEDIELRQLFDASLKLDAPLKSPSSGSLSVLTDGRDTSLRTGPGPVGVGMAFHNSAFVSRDDCAHHPSAWVLIRVIDCINNLVLCNATSHANAFRTAMKKSGMLDFRDSCVTLLLRGLTEMPPYSALEASLISPPSQAKPPASSAAVKRTASSTGVSGAYAPGSSLSTPRSWGSLKNRFSESSGLRAPQFAHSPVAPDRTADSEKNPQVIFFPNETVELAAMLMDSRIARSQFLSSFPFHSVADHKNFRDGGGCVLLVRAFVAACEAVIIWRNGGSLTDAGSAAEERDVLRSPSQTSSSSKRSRFSRRRKRDRANTAPVESRAVKGSSLDSSEDDFGDRLGSPQSSDVEEASFFSEDHAQRRPRVPARVAQAHARSALHLAHTLYELLTDVLATVEENRQILVSLFEDGSEMPIPEEREADALIDAFFVMRRLPGLTMDSSSFNRGVRRAGSLDNAGDWHGSSDSFEGSMSRSSESDEFALTIDDSADGLLGGASFPSFVEFFVSDAVTDEQRVVINARVMKMLNSSAAFKLQRTQLKQAQTQHTKRIKGRRDRISKLHSGLQPRVFSEYVRLVVQPSLALRRDAWIDAVHAHEYAKMKLRSFDGAGHLSRSRSSSSADADNDEASRSASVSGTRSGSRTPSRLSRSRPLSPGLSDDNSYDSDQ